MRANLLLPFSLILSLLGAKPALCQDQSWQAPGQSSAGNWQAPASNNNQANWPNPSGAQQQQWQNTAQPQQQNQWSQPPQANYAGASQAQLPAESGQYQEPGSYLNGQPAHNSYDQLSTNGAEAPQNNQQQGFQPDNTLQSQTQTTQQQGHVKKSHDGLKHALVDIGKVAAAGAGATAPLAGAMMMSRAMYPYGGMPMGGMGMGMPYGGYGYGGMPYGGYGYGGMPYGGGMMNTGMSNFLHF
jgi:hypothetical protein